MNIFQRKRSESDEDEQAHVTLSKAGFTVLEIYQLIQLRRNYRASELDHIAHEACDSLSEKMSIIKTVFATFRFNRCSGLVHSGVQKG